MFLPHKFNVVSIFHIHQEYILALVSPETHITLTTRKIADKDVRDIERSSKASLKWSPCHSNQLTIYGSELSVVLAQSMVSTVNYSPYMGRYRM